MIRRFALPLGLVLTALLALLVPRAPAAPPTIPARELLTLAQGISGANYTFDRTTSAALAAAQVSRPAQDASLEVIESALREAGFDLRPVGDPEKNVFLVQRTQG